jgi:hypothetical protein
MKSVVVFIAAVLCFGFIGAIAEPQVVLKQKGKEPELVDSARYIRAKKVYRITSVRGTFSLKKKGVEYCRPPRPKNFNKLSTIPELEKIMEEYEGLWWDVQAFGRIMPLYLGKGENKKAIKLFRRMDSMLEREIPASVHRLYWQAMMDDGGLADLEKDLIETAKRSPSRETCAVAYLMRGDLLMAQNRPKDALVHGYLKTVLMFDDVKVYRREALEKTVKTMEDLGDVRVEHFKKGLEK